MGVKSQENGYCIQKMDSAFPWFPLSYGSGSKCLQSACIKFHADNLSFRGLKSDVYPIQGLSFEEEVLCLILMISLLVQKKLNLTKTVRKLPIDENLERAGHYIHDDRQIEVKYEAANWVRLSTFLCHKQYLISNQKFHLMCLRVAARHWTLL